jgi:hypothetical protein
MENPINIKHYTFSEIECASSVTGKMKAYDVVYAFELKYKMHKDRIIILEFSFSNELNNDWFGSEDCELTTRDYISIIKNAT